jgi:hypothetical protein
MNFFGDLTATGPFSASTLLKVAAGAGAALVVLYILKLRLRTVEVPFSKLWTRVLKETQSSSLWRRLKRLLSLLIQAFLVFLLLTAVTDPRSQAELRRGRHILVLVDASASMKANDGTLPGRGKGPFTRLEEAKVKLKELLAQKRRRDKVMIVRMDSQVTAMNTWEDDVEALRRTVDKIHASDAPADLARGLRFAADTLRPVRDPHLIIVGDGGYRPDNLKTVYWGKNPPPDLLDQPPYDPKAAEKTDDKTKDKDKDKAEKKDDEKKDDEKKDDEKKEDEKKEDEETDPKKEKETKKKRAPKPPPLGGGAYLDPIGMGRIKVRSLLVGQSQDNIGIVAFNARRYLDDKLNYEVFARIKNYRKTKATVQVQLYSGGQIPDTSLLQLEPGETRTYIKRALPASGANLTMKLARPSGTGSLLDDFPLDDVAYALIPERPSLDVLLVSEGNLFLEGALLLDEQSSYDRIPHAKYDPQKINKYDAVIFDGYHGAKLPSPGNYLLFNPDPEKSPIKVSRQVKNPPIFWPSQPKHKRHPIMQYVTIKNVNTVRSSVFDLKSSDRPLMMTDERGPAFAAVRREKGLRLVVVGFPLKGTDWVIRISFPIFVLDCLGWFAGDDPRLIPTYRTGRTWRIPVDVATPYVETEDPKRHRFRAPVQKGLALVYGRHAGYYTLFAGKRRIKIAANLANPRESNIRVPEKLHLGGSKYGKDLRSAEFSSAAAAPIRKTSTKTWVLLGLLLAVGIALLVAGLLTGPTGPLWVFLGLIVLAAAVVFVLYLQDFYLWTCLLIGALVVLIAEWLTYNRRVTV